MPDSINIRHLGQVNYETTVSLMQAFTAARDANTPDEIWLLEHPPVFTLGTNAAEDHVLDAGDVPVVRTDRGGQVTWHGPGQLVAYLLVDLKRCGLSVKQLVHGIEAGIIETLGSYGINAVCKSGAPGVYVDGRKIASLGIRVKRGCSYHGLAINVHNDEQAFSGINPCGYQGLETSRVIDFCNDATLDKVGRDLLPQLIKHLQLSGSELKHLQQGWQPA